MAKVVVVYDSRSGNTEKMAEAIAEGAKGVKEVEVELHKIGTRFPICILDEADGIVFGSFSEYGNASRQMRDFIESVVQLKSARKLRLTGKIGGVFGSYAWDGGLVTERLAGTMKQLRIKLIPPMVSAVDKMGMTSSRIDSDSLQECRELGKAIAEKVGKA